MRYEREDSGFTKSWLDEFVSSPKLAKDLTSIYAEDVLQGIEDKSFANLDEALAALKTESGLTTAELSDVKRLVVAATEPESFVAEENIRSAKKSQLMKLLTLATTVCDECKEAPCVCSKTMSSPVAKAVRRIGLETLAEMCDKAEMDTEVAGEKGGTAGEEKKDEERLKEAEASVALAAEAERVRQAIASGTSVTEALTKSAKGMNPGFQAYLDKKKEEGEGGKKSSEEKTDKKDDKKTDKKASADHCPDCGAKLTTQEETRGKCAKCGPEPEGETSLKAKAERWADFLSTKGYFQGANEPVNTSDGVSSEKENSNDPEKLGYKSKDGIEYDRAGMAVPVGGDSREWEQKWFEGAADQTKKVMGPSGAEEKLKKDLLRARYLFHVRKLAQAKKKAVASNDVETQAFNALKANDVNALKAVLPNLSDASKEQVNQVLQKHQVTGKNLYEIAYDLAMNLNSPNNKARNNYTGDNTQGIFAAFKKK